MNTNIFQAYTHRKGLIAKLARFLEKYIASDFLYSMGWKEIEVVTTGTGTQVVSISFYMWEQAD